MSKQTQSGKEDRQVKTTERPQEWITGRMVRPW